MNTILKTLRLLALGLWLGSAVFFGAAVAPNLFRVLRGAQLANANEIAGMVVTRLLAIINVGGFVIALFAIATIFFVRKGKGGLALFLEMISLTIIAIMTFIGHWVVSARLLALRAAMQAPIDQLAIGDPRRVAFDRLHRYSVGAMGVAIVAGLVAFLVAANTRQRS